MVGAVGQSLGSIDDILLQVVHIHVCGPSTEVVALANGRNRVGGDVSDR